MSGPLPDADTVYLDGLVATMDVARPQARAIAVRDGRVLAVGETPQVLAHASGRTVRVDLAGRRVIPGLNDSHTHLIRGGLNYCMELRWDGVPTLADAMAMLRAQVAITPAPQWVRVVGGFVEHQFVEKRLPTLAELNAAAPHTPVFVLHLYDRALLNAAALRAVGYTRDTPDPPGGTLERDARGEPTGLLLARPNAGILYSTLARGPRLSQEDQATSTRLFMRELNRLGVTSVIDAGGGFQTWPDDYAVVRDLAADRALTVRIAYNLFTQSPGRERDDFVRWARQLSPGRDAGGGFLRHNGAGEMLVFSAADFEDFREPRPDLAAGMEGELFEVVRTLSQLRWTFRIHATYDESISRMLDVFERVDREVPLAGLRWFFDHAETISGRSIERVRALGGGIAIQHRMAYQGEYFLERYGLAATQRTPPVREMLAAGLPVGMGTDATRVASYNPWVGLQWLVTGRTVGGTRIRPEASCLDRETALALYTRGSAWFSGEEATKGVLAPGRLADFAVLSDDYFAVAPEAIGAIESVLTVVDGRIVHGADDFASLAPPMPRSSPAWSPVGRYRRFSPPPAVVRAGLSGCCASPCGVHGHRHGVPARAAVPVEAASGFWGALGCSCAV